MEVVHNWCDRKIDNGGRALINGMRGVAVGTVAGGITGYAGSTGKNTDIRR